MNNRHVQQELNEFLLWDIVWLKGWCAKHIKSAKRFGITQVKGRRLAGNGASY
jgi:hypothetical protein